MEKEINKNPHSRIVPMKYDIPREKMVGHWMMAAEPDWVNKEIDNWLSGK